MRRKLFLLSFLLSTVAIAPSSFADSSDVFATKSLQQRIAANEELRKKFADDYTDFKDYLSKEYNFDYSVDMTYLLQSGAPNGKKPRSNL